MQYCSAGFKISSHEFYTFDVRGDFLFFNTYYVCIYLQILDRLVLMIHYKFATGGVDEVPEGEVNIINQCIQDVIVEFRATRHLRHAIPYDIYV